MLTREESQKLYEALVGLDLRPHELKDRIQTFTEQRKIKEGDIYKNKKGSFISITSTEHYEVEGYPIYGVEIFSLYGESGSYTKTGIYNVAMPDCALDLSNRYKIVQIIGE
ncbi:MAG: hypothetical protein EHM25_14305 [Nitrosopumilales archaeon]|nr:MAG: hypothetical protein EHM25_14305 [Nitrosopumilales archaeon]